MIGQIIATSGKVTKRITGFVNAHSSTESSSCRSTADSYIFMPKWPITGDLDEKGGRAEPSTGLKTVIKKKSRRSEWKKYLKTILQAREAFGVVPEFREKASRIQTKPFPQFFLVTPPTRPWHSLLPHPPPASLPRNPLPRGGDTPLPILTHSPSTPSSLSLCTIQLLFFLRDMTKNLQSAFMHSQL